MCARFTLTVPPDEIAELLGFSPPADLPLRYNVAPTQELFAVRLGANGEPEASRLRWGLIPSWSHDAAIGNKLVNARAETVTEKPSFRAAWKRRRRCLIPADGFYDWKAVCKRKQPYLLRRPGGRPFAFAGLWERWEDEAGKPLETCTILTTAANAVLAPPHDRMPVILTDPEACGRWLAAADVGDLLRPCPMTR
jgi:putative SOS response-associated peptidase YedK